jgi:hypothetical protein
LVKPFIDKDTLQKLAVSSNTPVDEIAKFIPKTLILKEYGGENPLETPIPDFSGKE